MDKTPEATAKHICAKQIIWIVDTPISGHYECTICGKKLMIEDMYDKQAHREMCIRLGLIPPPPDEEE